MGDKSHTATYADRRIRSSLINNVNKSEHRCKKPQFPRQNQSGIIFLSSDEQPKYITTSGEIDARAPNVRAAAVGVRQPRKNDSTDNKSAPSQSTWICRVISCSSSASDAPPETERAADRCSDRCTDISPSSRTV